MSILRRVAFLLPILLLASRTAQADSVAVGDAITFAHGAGTTGAGEFILTVNGDPASRFATFCVNPWAYADTVSTFYVYQISDYAWWLDDNVGGDANGRDYLTSQTAWLYTKFRDGTLSGYDGSDNAADALQFAIWVLQSNFGSIDPDGAYAPLANYFIGLANQAVANGFAGLGDVKVLNLRQADGSYAQDQLVLVPGLPSPEPGSLALLGCGAAVLWASRRRATRKAQS